MNIVIQKYISQPEVTSSCCVTYRSIHAANIWLTRLRQARVRRCAEVSIQIAKITTRIHFADLPGNRASPRPSELPFGCGIRKIGIFITDCVLGGPQPILAQMQFQQCACRIPGRDRRHRIRQNNWIAHRIVAHGSWCSGILCVQPHSPQLRPLGQWNLVTRALYLLMKVDPRAASQSGIVRIHKASQRTRRRLHSQLSTLPRRCGSYKLRVGVECGSYNSEAQISSPAFPLVTGLEHIFVHLSLARPLHLRIENRIQQATAIRLHMPRALLISHVFGKRYYICIRRIGAGNPLRVHADLSFKSRASFVLLSRRSLRLSRHLYFRLMCCYNGRCFRHGARRRCSRRRFRIGAWFNRGP